MATTIDNSWEDELAPCYETVVSVTDPSSTNLSIVAAYTGNDNWEDFKDYLHNNSVECKVFTRASGRPRT